MHYNNKCAGIVTKIPAINSLTYGLTGKPRSNNEWE